MRCALISSSNLVHLFLPLSLVRLSGIMELAPVLVPKESCRSNTTDDNETDSARPELRSSVVDLLDIHSKDPGDQSERKVDDRKDGEQSGSFGLLFHDI